MGWNDRLPEDPYIPPDSYYEDFYAQQYSYEEWLEYVKNHAGVTSANIPIGTELQQNKTAPERFKQINRTVLPKDTVEDTPF